MRRPGSVFCKRLANTSTSGSSGTVVGSIGGWLAVSKRGFHFKAVGEVSHFLDASVFEHDFDDVEADFDGRIVYGVKVVQRGHAEETAFLSVDCRRRPSPSFVRAGFYLRKYQAVAVAQHQINFAAAPRMEIAH